MPICPICRTEKHDDAFLQFRGAMGIPCEACLISSLREPRLEIGPRFELTTSQQADRFAVNPVKLNLSWPPEEIPRYNVEPRVIEVEAKLDIREPESRLPLHLLEQLGFVPTDRLPGHLFERQHVDVEFEGDRFHSVPVSLPSVDGNTMILGWTFLLRVLMPGIQAGAPDWTRAEEARPERFGPILTMLSGISRTYSELRRVRGRSVLILGQDTTRISKLREIQRWLYREGYDGLIVKDLPDIPEQTVEEKVELLASMCKFAICECSIPSGHIDELAILRGNRVVTAILHEAGAGATWMQSDYPMDYTFISEFAYDGSIAGALREVCDWAEDAAWGRREALDARYPWRPG